MTRFTLLVLIINLIMISCGNSHNTALKNFIPGTYVTAYEGTYSIGNDTIEIRQQGDSETNTYLIIKRNAYQRKQKGTVKENINYKSSTWTGIFDENKKTVTVSKNGRTILFDIDQNEMKMGITVYKKLKSL